MAVPRARVLDLMKAQSRIFLTRYNPTGLRMGSRILRERLKGKEVASYYPPRIGTIKQLRALYPENTIIDEKEEEWVEHLTIARSRGKQNPPKKKTAAESKKFSKKR